MTYIYRLAGENLALAEAEVEGFLESQEIHETVERDGRLVFSESEPPEGQLRRLALVHEVSELIEVADNPGDIDHRVEESFRVRTESASEDVETAGLEERLGKELSTRESEVDLENPDEILKAYVTDGKIYLGRVLEDIDRGLYEKRSNQERPFSSPISLDPVLARVLVNLSGVRPGDAVLDPFCGTGGILIEAGLCGVGVLGADLQEKMVEGARKNLEEYGVIVHDIRCCGIGSISGEFENEPAAVVTDLPYGKSSKTEGEPVKTFAEKLDELAGKAVFIYNEPELAGMEANYSVYVHKYLTRY
ncbi:MAG: hypothetical protein ABEJ03_05065, partial [Candidatus Nanohaloarchaea archaeon]